MVAAQASRVFDSVSTADGPGAAILVDRGGTIIFRQARGSANVELGVPLAPAKVFRIASVTKMFTAALVLKLVEEGKLSLDDTLAQTLPDFPGARSITVRQLLSHTTGLSDKALLGDGASGVLRRGMTLPALTALIAKEPLRFTPGSSQAYANAGYILLGAVIEKTTGSHGMRRCRNGCSIRCRCRIPGKERPGRSSRIAWPATRAAAIGSLPMPISSACRFPPRPGRWCPLSMTCGRGCARWPPGMSSAQRASRR